MSSIIHLFLVFLKIGLFSIGGGYAIIPLIREQVVNECGWISSKMFTDIITISQMTPGPLAVNTSTFVGLQIGGAVGAFFATVGCVFCGIVICLTLYRFFNKNKESLYVFEVLKGLKSAALGLITSAAGTMIILAIWETETINSETFFSQLNCKALIIFLATLAIIRKWKPNPILIILISGLSGMILYL